MCVCTDNNERGIEKKNKTKREQDDNESKRQLCFQKRKTPAADFLINITSLDILKTLLHQCRS